MKAYALLLFAGMVTMLTACTTVVDLGHGRYAVPMAAEVRSPFGSNLVYGKLDDCEGYRPAPGAVMEYRDCKSIKGWSDALATQGQGGQILGGIAAGAGAAAGGAMVNTGASVTQSVIVPATKGHH